MPPGLVMLVAFSQTVEDVSENARANLEYIDMRFGAPVYIGDTIEVETKVLGVKPSSRNPKLGVVHVQSTARKNIGEADEAIVMTWQRKVQVWKRDESKPVDEGQIAADEVECELWLPPYQAGSDYKALAHLSSRDTYFEDLEPDTRIEHWRGRTMTTEHIHLTAILDNTSQVHCNQHMIDLNPKQYVGGKAHHLRRHPVRALPRSVVPRRRRTTRSATSSTGPGVTRRRSSPETPSSPRPRSWAAAITRRVRTWASSRPVYSGTSSRSRRAPRRAKGRPRATSGRRSSSWSARSW